MSPTIYRVFKLQAYPSLAHFKFALVCAFFIANSISFAQQLGSIGGKVIDAKTKESLPGATVYLANTTHGMSSNNDGSFLLNLISNGKYDLTSSMIGYKTFSKSVLIDSGTTKNFVINLEPEIKELDPIEVRAKKISGRSYYSEFKKLFLGQTQNSYRCEIVNQYDVFTYKDGPTLYALAHEPIQIVNNALGYRIFFDLKDFQYDYIQKEITYSGIARFEYLKPENEKKAARWNKERDRAYYGSIEHFFRSFKQSSLEANHFWIYDAENNKVERKELSRNSGDSVVYFKGDIKVVFDGEYTEPFYSNSNRMGNQISVIRLKGQPITVYDNGYYEDFHNIVLMGYFSWSHNIAEMLPLGYQPTSKQK
jgi:hypothetical protein